MAVVDRHKLNKGSRWELLMIRFPSEPRRQVLIHANTAVKPYGWSKDTANWKLHLSPGHGLFACTPSQINIAILIKRELQACRGNTVSNYIQAIFRHMHAELKGLNRYEKKKKKKKERERESESWELFLPRVASL